MNFFSLKYDMSKGFILWCIRIAYCVFLTARNGAVLGIGLLLLFFFCHFPFCRTILFAGRPCVHEHFVYRSILEDPVHGQSCVQDHQAYFQLRQEELLYLRGLTALLVPVWHHPLFHKTFRVHWAFIVLQLVLASQEHDNFLKLC